jgi:branched-chain amino acid transport system ATP-binding protein
VSDPLLTIENLAVRYGSVQAVRGIDLRLRAGEVVVIVGANGAGKTSMLNALAGLVPSSGTVTLAGDRFSSLPAHLRARRGIALVPEGRLLFGELSVEENLRVAAPRGSDPDVDIERVLRLFPRLAGHRQQASATLSGGEQQMVAIGRALMMRPSVLLMDEPSMGLAPKVVDEVFATIRELRDEGQTILLVEQNARKGFQVADRGYVLELGSIVLEGNAAELADNDEVRRAYLGI